MIDHQLQLTQTGWIDKTNKQTMHEQIINKPQQTKRETSKLYHELKLTHTGWNLTNI